MNPVAILYALSIGCFVLAGLILCYLIWDWRRVTRSIDRYRAAPDWMRRKTNKSRP